MNGLCPTIRDAIGNFLIDQMVSNRANGAIDKRRRVLGIMVGFAEEINWPALKDIGRDHIRQYMVALKSRSLWFDQRIERPSLVPSASWRPNRRVASYSLGSTGSLSRARTAKAHSMHSIERLSLDKTPKTFNAQCKLPKR